MRLLTLSFIILLLTSSFAAESMENKKTQKKSTDAMMPGYNAPCCKLQRSYDMYFSASFTYWQPIQENMHLGVLSNNTNPIDLVNGRDVDLNFKYKPGFKVGFDVGFGEDKWDSSFEYTWFRGTEHARVSLDPNNPNISLFPAWQIPDFLNPRYAFGSEKWKLHMDLADWDLGRNYFVGKKLCIRPFLGIRGAFIRQHVHVNYVNTNAAAVSVWPSTSIIQSSHSWGVGPRAGFTSDWKLGHGIRLFGDGEVDILFTRYNWRFTQQSNIATANRYRVFQRRENSLRAHLALDLGLGWGTCLSCDRYYIDVSANYGFQVFFDQNMFRSTSTAQSVGAGRIPNGNLYIQGVEATLRFDF